MHIKLLQGNKMFRNPTSESVHFCVGAWVMGDCWFQHHALKLDCLHNASQCMQAEVIIASPVKAGNVLTRPYIWLTIQVSEVLEIEC